MSETPWDRVRALAISQHGVVTLLQAREAGLQRAGVRHRLARGDIERVGAHCVRLVGSAGGWRQELTIGLLDLSDRSAAGGLAAAGLHRFDTCPEGAIEFVLCGPRSAPRVHVAAARVAAWVRPEDVVTEGPLRVLSPEATIVDLAGRVSAPRLEHIVDGALRDRQVTIDELGTRLAQWRRSGRLGVTQLEAVLDVVARSEAHSVLERLFFRVMTRAGVRLPEGQVEIVDREGVIGRFDAVYRPERVVIELQSRHFHADGPTRRRDARRRARVMAVGYEVLQFTYEEVTTQPRLVVATVLDALRRRPAKF